MTNVQDTRVQTWPCAHCVCASPLIPGSSTHMRPHTCTRETPIGRRRRHPHWPSDGGHDRHNGDRQPGELAAGHDAARQDWPDDAARRQPYHDRLLPDADQRDQAALTAGKPAPRVAPQHAIHGRVGRVRSLGLDGGRLEAGCRNDSDSSSHAWPAADRVWHRLGPRRQLRERSHADAAAARSSGEL